MRVAYKVVVKRQPVSICQPNSPRMCFLLDFRILLHRRLCSWVDCCHFRSMSRTKCVGLLRTEQYGVATELLNERKAKVKTTRLLYAKSPRVIGDSLRMCSLLDFCSWVDCYGEKAVGERLVTKLAKIWVMLLS